MKYRAQLAGIVLYLKRPVLMTRSKEVITF